MAKSDWLRLPQAKPHKLSPLLAAFNFFDNLELFLSNYENLSPHFSSFHIFKEMQIATNFDSFLFICTPIYTHQILTCSKKMVNLCVGFEQEPSIKTMGLT